MGDAREAFEVVVSRIDFVAVFQSQRGNVSIGGKIACCAGRPQKVFQDLPMMLAGADGFYEGLFQPGVYIEKRLIRR